MKCTQAMNLIDAEHDAGLVGEEMDRLRGHLAACSACRAYDRAAVALVEELRRDSDEISESHLSLGFSQRLGAALERENARREATPIAVFTRALEAFFDRRRHPVLAQALQGVVCATVLAIALLGSAWFLHAPTPPAPEYRFAHMAAFRMRTSGDGRVYAALTQHESAGRTDLEEVHAR